MKKYLIQTIKIITLGLILTTSFAMAQVFVGPISNPPATNVPSVGNITTPINDSFSSQVKSGGLWTGPLTVFGNSKFYGKQSIIASGNLYVSGKIGVGQGGTGSLTLLNGGPQPQYYTPVVDGGINPTRQLEIVNENSGPGLPFVKSYIKASSLAHSSTINYDSGTTTTSNLFEVCSDTTGKLWLCAPPELTPAPPYAPGSLTWNTPGSYSFVVPNGATSITVKTWGGGGGGQGGISSHMSLSSSNFGQGGNGGYSGTYTTQTYSLPNTNNGIYANTTTLSIKVGSGGPGGDGGSYQNNVDSYVAGGNGANGTPSYVKVGTTSLVSSAGGAGASGIYTSSAIGGSPGFASTLGGAGGPGGIDPGCNSAGTQGGAGGGPGGGGGGGSGARTCSPGGDHTGGAGGGGANGQVTVSWQ